MKWHYRFVGVESVLVLNIHSMDSQHMCDSLHSVYNIAN